MTTSTTVLLFCCMLASNCAILFQVSDRPTYRHEELQVQSYYNNVTTELSEMPTCVQKQAFLVYIFLCVLMYSCEVE